MLQFIQAIQNPDVPFLRYALIAGLLSSAAFGIVGTYVSVKRISYLAGAIAHSVLAGIGITLFFKHNYGIEWISPIFGAMIAALVSAAIIGLVSMYAKEREDTVIGAVWAIGMAIGLLFISRTSGYVDPMSYLFGNILIISKQELYLIAGLDIVVVIIGIAAFRQFQAISFDEEFARVRGVPTKFYNFLLLILTAVSIVLLSTIVGIIMVIALFTIPPAVGNIISKRLLPVMIIATVFTMLFTTGGLAVSYTYDFPSGPTIIVFAGFVYLVVLLIRNLYTGMRKDKGIK